MPNAITYEITVEGTLESRWTDWFQGMLVTDLGDGVTKLSGSLSDQAALHGVLAAIRDLNLVLLSVRQIASRGEK